MDLHDQSLICLAGGSPLHVSLLGLGTVTLELPKAERGGRGRKEKGREERGRKGKRERGREGEN